MRIFLPFLCALFFISLGFKSSAQCRLICNNNVEVALDPNCNATIFPDDVLENPTPGCPYVVTIFNQHNSPIGNTVNSTHLNQTLTVEVSVNGNKCWGSITVKDRQAPTINCMPTITTSCVDAGISGVPNSVVNDNCDPNPQIVVVSDHFQDLPCSNTFTGIRTITYRAVDASGNSSPTCSQTIQYTRPSLSQVTFPSNRDGITLPALSCSNQSWDLNYNSYPDPNEVGVPTINGNPVYPNNGFCDLESTFTDNQVNTCGGGFKILRTWRVWDWCSGSQRTHVQTIEVKDNTPPHVSCPQDITVNGGHNCHASVTLPAPHITSGCGGTPSYTVHVNGGTVQQVGNNYVVSGLAPGNYTATYSISNSCNHQTTSCHMNIHVSSSAGGPPVAICDQNTVVSLGSNGTARIYASTFNDGSYSNCGNISKVEVRRMFPGWCPPGVDDDTQFRNYVEFCCEDVSSSPIQVVVRVYDQNHQYNECMVWVTVQDKISSKLYCPPNIYIDCDYPLNLHDLSEFGTIVNGKNNRKPIIIDGKRVGYDGYVEGGCSNNVHITETVHDHTSCGNGGYIKRIFKVSSGGSYQQCSQKIFIKGNGGLNCHNIWWPKDVEISSCGDADVDPDQTGRPEVPNVGCGSEIAMGYEDLVLNIVEGACYKILRKWTVIDWCTYEANNPHTKGKCEYTQAIKVTDTEDPVFVDGCKDVEVCASNTNKCQGLVEIAPWVEDCTPTSHLKFRWRIDLDSDNHSGHWDISGSGRNFSRYLPFGHHTIEWTVTDGCGNDAKCSYKIRVKDCKEPTPYCHAGLRTVVMPINGMIEVEAHKFDVGSFDNCTENKDLIFSFSSDPTETTRIFTCEHVQEPQRVEIWVTDLDGNQDYCVTTLDIQDNLGTCPDTSSLVSGTILTPTNVGVPNANVFVEHESLDVNSMTTTDMDGYFEYPWSEEAMDDTVAVQPISDWEVRKDVSAYDMYLLQLHLLNLQTFDNEYQYIAADVNKDQVINLQDYNAMRDLLIRNTNSFPSNHSWRFVDANYEFYSMDSVFIFPEVKSVITPSDAAKGVNFVGVKIGDIDQSFDPSAVTPRSEEIVVYQEDRLLKAGETVALEITLPNERNWAAIEGTIDMNRANIISSSFNLLHVANNFVVATKTAKSAQAELSIEINNRVDGISVRELIQQVEMNLVAFDQDGKSFDIEIRTGASTQSVSVSTYPNPFMDQLEVIIETPYSADMTAELYNVEGKIVQTRQFNAAEGVNTINFQGQYLPSGIYQLVVKENEDLIWNKRVIKQ